MKACPHIYSVSAQGSAIGAVRVVSQGLPAIEPAPPLEFNGPGGIWSPENLLVAAIADCFILTFRSVSRAAHFDWEEIEAQVEGVLERNSGVTQFARYNTRATLTVKPGTDHAKARELLKRAEKVCLVSNSLRGERMLDVQIHETAA
jgi:organic hydroperoxide reductase OsmC/OhrA